MAPIDQNDTPQKVGDKHPGQISHVVVMPRIQSNWTLMIKLLGGMSDNRNDFAKGRDKANMK